MGNFKNRLKAMKENWANNREQEPDVPAGIYTMQLQNAELCESQSSGNLQIVREHLVIDGEYSGEVARDYMQLETEKGPQFIAMWIEQMGHDVPDDPENLEEVVAAIAEAAPTYKAQIKVTKDGFTNIRILSLLDGGEASTTDPEEPNAAAEEEPSNSDFSVGENVTFEVGGGELSGEITEIDGDEATVKVDDDEYIVSLGDLTASENDSGGDELVDQLISFAQSQDINVNDSDDADSITEKILEFEWDKKELLDEEVELLESIGAPFVTAEPKKKAVKKKAAKKKPTKKKGGK